MRKKGLIAFLLLSIWSAVPAAEAEYSPAELKTAIEYMAARGTPVTMDLTITTSLDAQMRNAPELLPYRMIFLSYFRKSLSFETHKQALAEIYVNSFTPEELAELLRFARSPLGKKLAETDAKIGVALSEMTSRKLEENLPALQKELSEKAGAIPAALPGR